MRLLWPVRSGLVLMFRKRVRDGPNNSSVAQSDQQGRPFVHSSLLSSSSEMRGGGGSVAGHGGGRG